MHNRDGRGYIYNTRVMSEALEMRRKLQRHQRRNTTFACFCSEMPFATPQFFSLAKAAINGVYIKASGDVCEVRDSVSDFGAQQGSLATKGWKYCVPVVHLFENCCSWPSWYFLCILSWSNEISGLDSD